MTEQKKIIKINWLELCCNCGATDLAVKTSRTDGKLNELDDVFCKCGMTGYIDIYDGCAFVCWNELTDDEIKYNKLKIMYDKLKYLIMKSNYGDEGYLRSYGAIE